jgi:signal transduction histidine kinase/ActR/RegA family two-component response regulator
MHVASDLRSSTLWPGPVRRLAPAQSGDIVRWFGAAAGMDEQKRAEMSQRFLADVSAALREAPEHEQMLQRVASLLVPALADFCFIDELSDEGSIQRVAWTHRDPAVQAVFDELYRSARPVEFAQHPIAGALTTGRSRLDERTAGACVRLPGCASLPAELLRDLEAAVVLILPLSIGERPLGALTLGCGGSSSRHWDAAGLTLAEQVAHPISLTIENARLYARLEEAAHRKDEFIAMLAHEMRNPLAPIRNALGLLASQPDRSEAARQACDVIDRQVHQLVRLVDDLLDLSRLSKGKLQLRRAPIALGEAVAIAVETSRPLIDARRHRLDVSIPDAPLIVDADASRLAQVLSNILNNAAKFTEVGGEIRVTVAREAGDAVIRVRDSGIGIPFDMLPRIFDLYAQAEAGLSQAQGGLGVGLTLVRRLVEMHGGSVHAVSAGPGTGSEFVVRLPALAPVAGDHSAAQPARSATAKRRILIVDDCVDAADSLRLLLELNGHRVVTAYDGTRAIERALLFRPDVVFLDIALPTLDGYGVIERLRAEPGFERVAFVATTGHGQPEDRRRSEVAGFRHHLAKPLDFDVIEGLLASLPAGE